MPQIRGGPGDPTRAAFTEGGYDSFEPQAFEPVLAGLYEAKTRLQNEHPDEIVRAASIRTKTHKLIVRPKGQDELYDCRRDPQLRHNLVDEPSQAALVGRLRDALLDRYITTTGVPPFDRDPRGLPPPTA